MNSSPVTRYPSPSCSGWLNIKVRSLKMNRRKIIFVILAFLAFFHVVSTCPRCMSTLLWRLRRYSDCNSDLVCWRKKALHFSDVVDDVCTKTPRNARIVVYGSAALANEILFYAFPRSVELRKVDNVNGKSGYVISKMDSGAWMLSPADL